MKRHVLPALAALTLVLGGPQRARLESVHAPRVLLFVALAAGLLAAGRVRRRDFRALEWAAVAALGAMGVATLFAASPAYALTPLVLAAAALAVMLGGEARGDRELWLQWLGGAVVVVAVLGLAEALDLGPGSLPGRAPSATMGQRNALAHVLLLGSPLTWALAARATKPRERLLWWGGAALLAVVIVLTRCRAAWLTIGPALVCFTVLSLIPRVGGEAASKQLGSALATALGAAVALAAPVAQQWKRPHPYADSFSRLVDWHSGSGAGRLDEWKASLMLLSESPVLGLGPGQWFVQYGVAHASGHFAHSDWVGWLIERGVVGVGLLGFIAIATVRRWWGHAEFPLIASTLLVAACLGALDSVLQLPAPLLLVSVVLFVGSRPGVDAARNRIGALVLSLVSVVLLSGVISLALSTAERTPFEQLELAARLQPLDGELRFTLAEAWTSAGDCERARPHTEALRALLPRHPSLATLDAACH